MADSPAAYEPPGAILEDGSSHVTAHATALSTNGMWPALLRDQRDENQNVGAPREVGLHPSPIGTQVSPDIELMPEDGTKRAEARASRDNQEFRARHELEWEQKRDAAQAIAERLRPNGLGPPKPEP
jgi:hypothetical protein